MGDKYQRSAAPHIENIPAKKTQHALKANSQALAAANINVAARQRPLIIAQATEKRGAAAQKKRITLGRLTRPPRHCVNRDRRRTQAHQREERRNFLDANAADMLTIPCARIHHAHLHPARCWAFAHHLAIHGYSTYHRVLDKQFLTCPPGLPHLPPAALPACHPPPPLLVPLAAGAFLYACYRFVLLC